MLETRNCRGWLPKKKTDTACWSNTWVSLGFYIPLNPRHLTRFAANERGRRKWPLPEWHGLQSQNLKSVLADQWKLMSSEKVHCYRLEEKVCSPTMEAAQKLRGLPVCIYSLVTLNCWSQLGKTRERTERTQKRFFIKITKSLQSNSRSLGYMENSHLQIQRLLMKLANMAEILFFKLKKPNMHKGSNLEMKWIELYVATNL